MLKLHIVFSLKYYSAKKTPYLKDTMFCQKNPCDAEYIYSFTAKQRIFMKLVISLKICDHPPRLSPLVGKLNNNNNNNVDL